MNKGAAAVMSLILILSSFALPVRADETDGAPGLTEIHIETVDDLKELARNCRLDSWSVDKKVILDKSLELQGEEFTAIPTFGGIFDGKGHTIDGISITLNGSYQGLFRYVQEGAVIRNLTVQGSVAPSGTSTFVGGVAGSNRGMIINCKFSGVSNGKNNVGGIAGSNEESGVISGCIAEGMIYGEHYAGGIAGMNLGSIDNCSNSASVNTRIEQMDIKIEDISVNTLTTTEDAADITDIGGITGYSSGLLDTNKNYGDIGYQHKGYNIGGIVGRQSGYITGCQNYGRVYGRKEVGGIVGQMEPYKNLTFSENTLTRLRNKVDDLQNGIDKTIRDARGYSDSVSDALTRLSGEADAASSSLDILLDGTEKMINADIAQVNNLSDVISKALDMLVSANSSVEAAAGEMSDAAGKLKDAADAAGNISGDSSEIVRILKEALDSISVNQENIDKASEAVNNAMDALNDSDVDAAEEYLREALDSMNDSINGLSDAVDKAAETEPYFTNINNTLSKTFGMIKDGMGMMEDAGNDLSDCAGTLSDIAKYLSSNVDFKLSGIDSTQVKAREDLMASIDSVFDIVQELNLTMSGNNNVIADDIQFISDTLFDITDIIIDAREDTKSTEDERDINSDVSEEDEEGASDGKADMSVNYGEIQGDVNVGGIAGAMAVEHDLDPEDDIDIQGDVSSDFDYSTKAVIRDCANYGNITGKKDGIGGIVGDVELGCVIASDAFGRVESTGGDYVGGIAGICRTLIRDSNAKCSIAGGSFIGGIAGSANDIRNSNSLIRVEESDENTGAIAGELTGEAQNNYFVHRELAGIDGISYSGMAEPLDYSEFIGLEGLPDEFKAFVLTFIANGEEVYKYEFTYGDSLAEENIPPIPPREGFQAHWEDYDYSFLSFDDTISAVYEQYVTALESDLKRSDDRALLLVEGSFTSDDAISVTCFDELPVVEQKTASECFVIDIPDDGSTVHRIHYILPDDISNAKIMLYTEEGQWIETGTDTDGKYLVFDAEGSSITFCVVRAASVTPLIIIIPAAAAVVIILILIAGKRRIQARQHKNIQ